MPGKGGKAARKAEEEAKRLADLEDKARGIAKKTFEQIERERHTGERVEKEWRQQEHIKLLLERERLDQETESYRKVGSEKLHRLELKLSDWAKQNGWRNIIVETWLPDVHREADINAFLTIWREEDNSAGEGMQRDLGRDLAQISEAHELTEMILATQDEERTANALGKGKALQQIAWHRRNLMAVYESILEQFDKLTANVLHFLDQYVDKEDEMGMLKCQQNDIVRFGLWAGDRRGRGRSVDYADIGVYINPKEGVKLPDGLGLLKLDRSIRVIQLHFDPMTLRSAKFREPEQDGHEYAALACIVFIEVLQCGKPPYTTGHWTLRTETKLTKGVQRHPYPPVSQKGEENAQSNAPVRLSIQIPDRVVIRHRAPFIGVWKEEEGRWRPEGTSEYDYKRDERKATFVSQYLGCLAVVQEKGFDVPYESWHLFPRDDDEVLFVIEGKRRGEISDREIHIQVRDNRCRVLEPPDQELAYLRDSWLPPATLLRCLADSGFIFVFSDADAHYFPDVVPKSRVLEKRAYEDIAHFCSVHAFGSSKHNATRVGKTPSSVPEDPSMGLFRVSKEARPEGGGTPFSHSDLRDEAKWNCVRYEENRCAFCRSKDGSEIADIQDMEGHETHLNLFTTLSASGSPDEVRRRYDNGNLLLHQAVHELLCLTRPLSFG